MSLKAATEASSEFRNAVFGFVREHENRESMNVPAIIKYLVLNYYFLNEALFAPGKLIALDEDSVARRIPDVGPQSPRRSRCVFGSIEIGDKNDGIEEYRWTLRMIRPTNDFGLSTFWIGLGMTVDAVVEGHDEITSMFGLGILRSPPGMTNSWLGCKLIDDECEDYVEIPDLGFDEQIQMCLNMERKELSFHIQGTCVFILDEANGFKEGKLRLMVEMMELVATVQLMDFSIRHRDE